MVVTPRAVEPARVVSPYIPAPPIGDAIIEELRQRVGIGRRIIIIVGALGIIGITIILSRCTWMFCQGRRGSDPISPLPTTKYHKEDQSQQEHEYLHGYLLTMQISQTFPSNLPGGPT
jgi:hypothetical protein